MFLDGKIQYWKISDLSKFMYKFDTIFNQNHKMMFKWKDIKYNEMK